MALKSHCRLRIKQNRNLKERIGTMNVRAIFVLALVIVMNCGSLVSIANCQDVNYGGSGSITAGVTNSTDLKASLNNLRSQINRFIADHGFSFVQDKQSTSYVDGQQSGIWYSTVYDETIRVKLVLGYDHSLYDKIYKEPLLQIDATYYTDRKMKQYYKYEPKEESYRDLPGLFRPHFTQTIISVENIKAVTYAKDKRGVTLTISLILPAEHDFVKLNYLPNTEALTDDRRMEYIHGDNFEKSVVSTREIAVYIPAYNNADIDNIANEAKQLGDGINNYLQDLRKLKPQSKERILE